MTAIYHFTHLINVEQIIRDGGLFSDGECLRQKKKPARSGNSEIKQRRLTMPIKAALARGGVVGDYVPFYFATRSPMLLNIQTGKVPGVDSNADQIAYLVARAEDFPESTFVVTDGNAAVGFSDQYGTFAEMASAVDWPLMKERIWKNTDDDGDRVRRRMAEFLVHRFVPWDRIHLVATRTRRAGDAVRLLYDQWSPPHQPPIEVHGDWYYP